MLRVSVIELPARWDGATEALHEVDEVLSRGPATDLAVVPEMAFTGYVSPEGDFDLRRFGEPLEGGPTTKAVIELAQKHQTHIVAPLVLREDGKLYNACFVASPRPGQGIVATYRKRHPWFPETWATKGSQPSPVFEIDGMKITFAICYDAHFLAHDTAAILKKSDVLVFTSAWVDEEDSRMPLLTSLARKFRIAIVNANWAPGIVSVRGQGASCILNAEGTTLATVQSEIGEQRIDALLSLATNTPPER